MWLLRDGTCLRGDAALLLCMFAVILPLYCWLDNRSGGATSGDEGTGGAATTLRIAGAMEDGKLMFSVADDGCGFDPMNRPGLAEGHFGLQGVEERVEELGGKMSISSAPGKGTRVSIWIKAS